jgi:hypothetical protein
MESGDDMKRALTALALSAMVVAGCGGSDDAAPASAASTPAPESSTAPAPDAAASTTGAPTTAAATTAAPTTAAPTTAAPTESTTVNQGRAAAALLTTTELTGWTQGPADEDDSDLQYDAPECAALQQIESLPGSDDDADTTLIAPDGKLQIDENVTVSDAATVQTVFNVFSDPVTADCLTALFTTLLSQPGATPEGVTITGIQFAQEPLTGGEQAVGYVATLTFTGTETGVSAPLGFRFDAVKQGEALALLVTTIGPGADPVDPAAIAAAAGAKLAAVG